MFSQQDGREYRKHCTSISILDLVMNWFRLQMRQFIISLHYSNYFLLLVFQFHRQSNLFSHLQRYVFSYFLNYLKYMFIYSQNPDADPLQLLNRKNNNPNIIVIYSATDIDDRKYYIDVKKSIISVRFLFFRFFGDISK